MQLSELLILAERLARQRGLDALTMDSLAAAAGISRATLYRQVGSREALLKRLAGRGMNVGARADVRERILQAAGEIFPRVGMDAGTVEAIAEAAGVGPATVYRHFGDKKGLVAAFLATQAPRRAVWALAHKPSGDLRGDLLQLATAVLGFMKSHGGLMRLAILERARGGDVLNSLSSSPDRTVHACTELLSYYVARGELVDEAPQSLARAFMGILFSFGMFGPLLGLPSSSNSEHDAPLAVDLFLRGAGCGSVRRARSPRRKP